MEKKLNKKIEIKNEKQIKLLIVCILIYYTSRYIFDITDKIPTYRETLYVSWAITTVVVALIYIIYRCMWKDRGKIHFLNFRQYIVGIVVTLLLCTERYIYGRIVGEVRYGFSMPAVDRFILDLISIFVFTAFSEELVSRIVIQDSFSRLLGKKLSFVAPIISALCFAVFHYPQMGMVGFKNNFFVGLVLGFSRQYIPDCTLISLTMAHGFMNLALLVGIV